MTTTDWPLHSRVGLPGSSRYIHPHDQISRDTAEPTSGTWKSTNQAQLPNGGAPPETINHEDRSTEREIIHFSDPELPRSYYVTPQSFQTRQVRKDIRRNFKDCARVIEWGPGAGAQNTGGELSMDALHVAVETGTRDRAYPYVVLGLLSSSTSIPKEVLLRIRAPGGLFDKLRKGASKLRPWPIRLFSLKSESGFGVYECARLHGVAGAQLHMGYGALLRLHRPVQVDQHTQQILDEMFRAYRSKRRDIDGMWLSFVHKQFNGMRAHPQYGKYSLHLVLGWSPFKIVVWGSIPILLSLGIGFWYMFKQHPGDDPVAVVQTAWGIASYIVTAGALAIAVGAAATQLGNN